MRARFGFGTMVVAAVLALVVLAAAAAPLLAPQDPYNLASLRLIDSLDPPSFLPGGVKKFPLGTDAQGRDVLSSILYGARLSFLVGGLAVVLAALIGVPLGLIAGYAGGVLDAVLMRFADAQLAVPAMLVALLADGIARAVLPPHRPDAVNILILIGAIGLARWPQFARVVRTSAQLEGRRDYVAAARLARIGTFDIALDHVLPNVLGPVLVLFALSLGLAVIDEATLSFLGVGLAPTHPSLGTLIRVDSDYLLTGDWWLVVFPALALAIPVLAANLLGDALRDRLDPAGQVRRLARVVA
jgi:peptide/nickel transport system permease protein